MNDSRRLSFSEAIAVALSCRNDKSFLLWGNEILTYGTLLDRIARLSTYYRENGIACGDRLVIASRNDSASITIFLSLLVNGITAIMIDPALPAAAAKQLLERVQPRLLFADDDIAAGWDCGGEVRMIKIRKEVGRAGALFSRLMGRDNSASEQDPGTYPAMLKKVQAYLPKERVDPETTAYIVFTSGTTSQPKGVEITHGALCSHLITLSREFGYTSASRILNILPLHHVDGLVQGPLAALWNGALVSRPTSFSINRIPQLLDRVYSERITHFISTPTMLALILRYGGDCADSFRTEDFKFIVSAAAKLNSSLWSEFEDRFGVMVVNLYGLTETVTGSLFAGPRKETRKIGTVGVPVDCEAIIVDGQGAPVAWGERGELLLRGPHLMRGYFDDTASTDAVIRSGWLHTGDLAERDSSGFFRIIGRLKNVIISGGTNVYPDEVTEVIARHPAVVEAVTFGVEDEVWGERVFSCVVLIKGSSVEIEDLFSYCRTALSPAAMPDRIILLSDLPKGPAGKVIISEARELAMASLSQSSIADEMMSSIDATVLRIAGACLNLPVTTLSSASNAQNTPGWDSLAHLELIVAVEKAFSVRLDPVDILSIESLGDLCRVVGEKRVESL